ncbi:MAG TPA: response regulator transcription factor [Candidatus Wallbacteria bacterium]|nr:response regulator transcription factor [Candidatus Wallbacteria bacterium]
MGLSDQKILVIEDDMVLVKLLARSFQPEGVEIDSINSFVAASEKLESGGASEWLKNYYMIVLDVNLGDGSGLDILSKMRKIGLDIPVIILSGSASEKDRIMGLETGADDYLCKPFSLKELKSRIKAISRRVFAPRAGVPQPRNKEDECFSFNGLNVNFSTGEVIVDNVPVSLSYTEFLILKTLNQNMGKLIKRDDLIKNVWGDNYIESSSLDPHISRLRKKIAPYGAIVSVVPRLGYKLKI